MTGSFASHPQSGILQDKSNRITNKFSLVETERQGVGYRSKKFPQRGIGVLYLQKMLELVRSERQMTEIFARSPYRFKKSTLVCLKWCVEKKLITRKEVWKKKNKKPNVFYEITDSGRSLLGLIV